ncbi:hypothetical protein [Enterococcus florum]|nr:hypothetical protein [Enterococcus florum]
MAAESVIQQILGLKGKDPQFFGRYLLKQDFLEHKIPANERAGLIKKALDCGRAAAQTFQVDYQSIPQYLEEQQIAIHYFEEVSAVTKKDYTLARITLPDQVFLNRSLIDAGEAWIKAETRLHFVTEQTSIETILIAHELYHSIETCKKLYTTQKHLTYRVGPFKKHARLHSLSEIAATAFVQELYGLVFSPLLLNPVLIYPVDPPFGTEILQQFFAEDVSRKPMD